MPLIVLFLITPPPSKPPPPSGAKLSLRVLLMNVTVPATPPAATERLTVMFAPQPRLPLIVLPVIVRVPLLAMPPPIQKTPLFLIVLSIIVMVPRFDMPPPLPAGNSFLIHTGTVVAHDAISDRPLCRPSLKTPPPRRHEGNAIEATVAIHRCCS